MSAPFIQANYEELTAIANRFGAQSKAQADLQNQIKRAVQPLQQRGWQGQGSTAFFAEMNGKIFPAMRRLVEALEQARSVTLEVKVILQKAEEEAALPFKGEQKSSKQDGGGLWGKIGEWVHGALDLAGFVPVIGEAADGINGLIYLAEGRYVEAGISAAAMIPIFGDAGKVGKWAAKAGKEIVGEGAERLTKEGVETLAERGAKQIDEFLRFGELKPNTVYVRNGYNYGTDSLGRVERVSGELRLEKASRTPHQTEVGYQGIDTDEGGHLIGARFGGSPEGVNLVPQNVNLNRSDWKIMENDWERALKQDQQVRVNINIRYPQGQTMRPAVFDVRYEIDGKPLRRTFRNRAGG